jgi:hypothetical protein
MHHAATAANPSSARLAKAGQPNARLASSASSNEAVTEVLHLPATGGGHGFTK